MSVEPNDDALRTASDFSLAEALIAHCRLSPQEVARITEDMHATKLSFEETACQLNLATRKDVEDVRAWMHGQGIGGATAATTAAPGIFERALHNVQSTALTVRRGLAKCSEQLRHVSDLDHPRNEQVRALRTDLMLLDDSNQRGHTFALIGPGRREGRSQLCAELAIAFAQLGRRALLIDADLRHPCQHVLFGADNQWGLSQALSLGEAPYLNSVDGLPELTLLTAGAAVPNPLELVSHRRFARLLGTWRNQYDFIIIDTPPVSQYADALQIASVARRVVAVSRSEVTSIKDMKDMLRRLAVTDSTILGAVVNKF
jgi:protein-tyrosine kinase